IALVLAASNEPQEMGIIRAGTLSFLTDFNQKWLGEVTLSVPITIAPQNGDGDTVPGWILKPSGLEPGKRYPLVLYIHGGPHAQYGNTLFHELQWLAAEGFAVVYTNPRGSKGY